MATPLRRSSDSLIDRLWRSPERFEFFRAVRLLEIAGLKATNDSDNSMHGAAPAELGADADPQKEALRFRALQGRAFPRSAITALQKRSKGQPEMTVAIMGLTGPLGVLPPHYTETVSRSLRARSFALRDFLDVFNHRLVSLFYRAWEKYRLPAARERAGSSETDPISESLFALIGLGTEGLRHRLETGDEPLLHYSGFFAHQPRSATALQALLTDFFRRPMLVRQFQGRWARLAEDERSRLNSANYPQGRFAQLGINAMLGERAWDVQGSFRISVGPLDYEHFLELLPGRTQLTQLAQLTRLFVGPALSFDLQLTLRSAETPDLQLASDRHRGPYLGWNTWLKHRPFLSDADDAVFVLDRV